MKIFFSFFEFSLELLLFLINIGSTLNYFDGFIFLLTLEFDFIRWYDPLVDILLAHFAYFKGQRNFEVLQVIYFKHWYTQPQYDHYK